MPTGTYLTIDSASVKALAGITGTSEDARITALTTFFVTMYESLLMVSAMSDADTVPVINSGVTYIIAEYVRGGASTESVGNGPATRVTVGPLTTEYGRGNSMFLGPGSLLSQGLKILAPYYNSPGAETSNESYQPFIEDVLASDGSVSTSGNLNAWDR